MRFAPLLLLIVALSCAESDQKQIADEKKYVHEFSTQALEFMAGIGWDKLKDPLQIKLQLSVAQASQLTSFFRTNRDAEKIRDSRIYSEPLTVRNEALFTISAADGTTFCAGYTPIHAGSSIPGDWKQTSLTTVMICWPGSYDDDYVRKSAVFFSDVFGVGKDGVVMRTTYANDIEKTGLSVEFLPAHPGITGHFATIKASDKFMNLTISETTTGSIFIPKLLRAIRRELTKEDLAHIVGYNPKD